MERLTPEIDWPPADSDEFVRLACIFAEHLSADELRRGLLTHIRAHGRSLLAHFQRLLLSERIAEPDARATMVAALGWAGQDSSTTAVRAALDDSSPQVLRAAARAAWSELRQPRLIPRLMELLNGPRVEPDVAVAAAESLSHFQVAQALAPMVRLALDPRAGLTDEEREQLLVAIERLAGQTFGDPAQTTLRRRLGRLRTWWRQENAGD